MSAEGGLFLGPGGDRDVRGAGVGTRARDGADEGAAGDHRHFCSEKKEKEKRN